MTRPNEVKARAELVRAVCADHESIGDAARLWGISKNTLYWATSGRRTTDDLLLRIADGLCSESEAAQRLRTWAGEYRAWLSARRAVDARRPWVAK